MRDSEGGLIHRSAQDEVVEFRNTLHHQAIAKLPAIVYNFLKLSQFDTVEKWMLIIGRF